MNDLHDRLDNAFSAITPAPAPIDAAMKQGKRIRLRRRATAVASVAAVVAAAVALPLTMHVQASPVPETGPGQYTVSVFPHDLKYPSWVVAQGMLNGKKWQFNVSAPGGASRGSQYVSFDPPDKTDFLPGPGRMMQVTALSTDLLGSSPAGLWAMDAANAVAEFGVVQADVDHLTVTLTNGATLTLHPVPKFGARLVVFVVPRGAVIVHVTAYSRAGEIASAIPFYNSAGTATFATWLRPGQQGVARDSRLLASGSISGQEWSVTAYTGPWGVCFEMMTVTTCTPITHAAVDSGNANGIVRMFAIEPDPSVIRVDVRLPGGTAIATRLVTVGRHKFFAFAVSATLKPGSVRWTEYDKAGHQVASGTSY
ncbi:MAG TPA: hypothetical protein VF070_01825 [Streptosporangiaceae bacterium]